MDCSIVARRRQAFAGGALLLCAQWSTAHAALISRFDFEDASGNFANVAEDRHDRLSITAWSDADGTAQSVANPPGFALTSRSYHDGNRLLLTLFPTDGFTLRLTGLDFEHRATATGPTSWQLLLADVPLLNGTTATTFKTEQLSWAAQDFTAPLTLALHGAGASSAAGTWRIDNVALHGSLLAPAAVPLPPAGWLFGTGLLALLRAQRARPVDG